MIRRLIAIVLFSLITSVATAEEAAPASPDASASANPPALIDASASFALVSRHLRYHDDLHGFLRPYDLPAGGAFGFALRAFPGARARSPIAQAVGAELRFERTVGVETERSGVRYPTANQILEVNLLGRWVLGRHEILGVLGYGDHAFVLERSTPSSPSTNAAPDVPNVRYSYLRLGAETRVRAHRLLSVQLSAAYLQVFDAGGIEDALWFPRARSAGVAFGAKAIVPITHGLEARAGLEYRRYFFDLRPQVGDPIIAGGALDQYVLTRVELAYRY